MGCSLNGVKQGSLVHKFISSGKHGFCELCRAEVEKLEAHHVSYSPEITLKICHNCHHKVHFWPGRLSELEKLKLLSLRLDNKTAYQILNENKLGIFAIAKLIAPSRNVFVRTQQSLDVKRISNPRQKEVKVKHTKVFKGACLGKNDKKPAPVLNGAGK